MTTDAEYRKIKRLAGRAGALLADDDFKDMLADLKNAAIRDWANGDTTAKREDAWHTLQAVGRLENLMRGYGQTLRAADLKNG
jgi:hypothetical protein